VSSPAESILSTPSLASALIIGEISFWMVDHPFKERMRIHQRLDIEKRSDIELTPFGVNSLKFPCLPHPGKYFIFSQDGNPFHREES
jgi:hypothetical protein